MFGQLHVKVMNMRIELNRALESLVRDRVSALERLKEEIVERSAKKERVKVE